MNPAPLRAALLGLALALPPAIASGAAPRADQLVFRELFRELVETNTTLSSGSCTLAAERMAARLRKAGLPEQDIQLVVLPDKPKEGNLVAVLRGSDAAVEPMLLLAHIDVVEAKREDWTRDPFTLVEEDGFFYARGVADDKAMASIWVDTLVRFLQSGHAPKRTIKLALTCGEETSGAFNGAEYLSTQRKELIEAAFALNEGAWGMLDPQGKRIMMTVQVGEKTSQNYRLEVTNPGGHSSRPVKENAIYRLIAGVSRIGAFEFPVQLNDTTRGYFGRLSDVLGGEMGAAMKALLKDPSDAKALATVADNPVYNATLRTTCVATLLNAGHATNALPQRATANVNCRIFPGTTPQQVRDTLATIVDDSAISITLPEVRGPAAISPPLTPAIMGPIEQVAAKIYPGLPVVPIQQSGATDAQFTGNAGIPTYGIGALFFEHDLGGVHGLNEKIRVASLYDGRDFLYELVRMLGEDTTQIP